MRTKKSLKSFEHNYDKRRKPEVDVDSSTRDILREVTELRVSRIEGAINNLDDVSKRTDFEGDPADIARLKSALEETVPPQLNSSDTKADAISAAADKARALAKSRHEIDVSTHKYTVPPTPPAPPKPAVQIAFEAEADKAAGRKEG